MSLVGEQIPDYVKEQIKVRQKAHGSGISSDLLRTDETLIYTNSRNAFIKMASGVSVSVEKLTELGYGGADLDILQGMGLAKNHVLFGGTSILSQTPSGNGVLQQKTNFLGINGAYSADSDFGIVPMPGIESLEVKSLNRGSLKKATIKLTAQTRNQLAVLDVLYMRLGYTVLIEWGNSIYLASKNRKTLDDQYIESGRLQQMYTSIIEDNKLWFNPSWSARRSPADITGKIAEIRDLYDGNFDALLGKVSNFNWSFNPDGSYDIELTVISLGDVVESLKVNVPAAYNTMQYVTENGTGWITEDDTLDQHRKDNIILSLLHTLRLLNQNPTGEKITIHTKNASGVEQPIAYPGRLLTIGGNTVTVGTHSLTITTTVGFKNSKTGEFIQPDELKEIYFNPNTGIVISKEDAQKFASLATEGNSSFPKSVEDYKGYGWYLYNAKDYGSEVTVPSAIFTKNYTFRTFTRTKTFSQVEWDEYLRFKNEYGVNDVLSEPKAEKNPVVVFRNSFKSEIADKAFPLSSTTEVTTDSGKESITPVYLLRGIPEKVNGRYDLRTPNEIKQFPQSQITDLFKYADIKFDKTTTRTEDVSDQKELDNPLKGTGFEKDDAFVLNLDKPQYYIRFGYLLSLLKKKVITRINVGKSNYDDNPNLFNIDINEDNSLMLCLPKQISFDWRTCIVKRDDFDRKNSWKQKIFPQLRLWHKSKTNTAFALNIYLNFNFIAESMTSNSDDRGNISVYDFIKSICDGINKAMGGINNLEPVIDEDTNTLRIFESSPIPKDSINPGYKLQLYGYGNGVTNPKNSSTFVRKVDLKTAITPEYATMITVGATAGGYVKGTEATAFSKWNDGLIDRFKSELIAADSETKKDGRNDREDTAANFQLAMDWTARCFGIEGAGKIWECFPG